MSFSALAIKEEKLFTLQDLEEFGEKERICSKNTKTGWSINFPITYTCSPTLICKELCYGSQLNRPVAWEKSLLKYHRVLQYFKQEDPQIIADKIAQEYKRHKMTFLRWNGVGDLFPDAVHVVNRLPEWIILWLVTRKPTLAAHIRNRQGLYLMFSLDGSEDSLNRKKVMDNYNHPRVYYSYLRTEANENTLGASIIFNLQQKKGQLPYDDPKRCCPVDAGIIPTKGACGSCRKCFSPGLYNENS